MTVSGRQIGESFAIAHAFGNLQPYLRCSSVQLAPELKETTYGKLAWKPVSMPRVTQSESTVEALDWHRGCTGLPGSPAKYAQ